MSALADTDALIVALDVFAARIADGVLQRLTTAQVIDWIDQARSPLGPRRHRTAVLRRLGRGEPGAVLVGRRHLLSKEAMNEELARLTTKGPKPRAESVEALADELGLRMVKGGRK